MCTAAVFESVSSSPGNCVQSDVSDEEIVGNCTSFGSLEDVSPLTQEALDGGQAPWGLARETVT